MEPIRTSINNAELMAKWIKDRGGVAQWDSVDLSDQDREWLTPALNSDGKPYPKPHWKCADRPTVIETNPKEIHLINPKEVKRFRIGVKMGDRGLSTKVTAGGTRRIRAALEKYGDESWYGFDYQTQEAVIYVPDKIITLKEYLERENEWGRN